MAGTGFETTEFRHEFQAETARLLRGRLIWFASIWMTLMFVLMMVSLAIGAIFAWQRNDGAEEPIEPARAVWDAITAQLGGPWTMWLILAVQAAWFACYAVVIWLASTKRVGETGVLRLTIGLVLLEGTTQIIARWAGIPGSGVFWVVVLHFVMCCVFPWTVRQAVLPIAIVLVASGVSHIVFEGTSINGVLLGTLFLSVLATPGILIVWWRFSQRMMQSSNRFLQKRYGMLRQELAYAREVHEALFPTPRLEGDVRLAYEYEPMRQIGGDYLFAHLNKDGDNERVSVVLLDVTGHGIPAALTVNRLHGEIDLRFAAEPDIAPGELLARLNNYVQLTLAKHSIYATAICLRADPARGVVEYASGGHPPAFLRGVDGTLANLDPTTFVLGAVDNDVFDRTTREVRFGPGDTLIAYTDGATEARAPTGKMLRIDGLRGEILAGNGRTSTQTGEWSGHLLRKVAAHRGGLPPEDDTLIVELFRPLGGAAVTP